MITFTTGLILLLGTAAQLPELVRVGRVTAVYWPGDEGVATALAEVADRGGRWPGIPQPDDGEVRLVVVRGESRFDSLTAGRVPAWGAGAAFPGTNTVVVRLNGDPRRVLRHELAHLALRRAVRQAPLWFDEGYAAFAAGEWDRLDALRLNLELLRGRIPELRDVAAQLRGGEREAGAAYALATSAVLLLHRLGGPRGLEPLIVNLGRTGDFDQGLRATYGMSLGQFEDRWRRDLRGRYGWLLVGTSFAVLWLVVLGVVGSLWLARRRRERARREALDEGWVTNA